MGEPNPYLLGMAVLVKVQVLTALCRVDDVLAAGEGRSSASANACRRRTA